MKHTQIKVLLDAIKQHIIKIYQDSKGYISPLKTDSEKFQIIDKKINNIKDLHTLHLFRMPNFNIHKDARNERNPNRLYSQHYTSIMNMSNVYHDLKDLCKKHKQMMENSPGYTTCNMDMANDTPILKAADYIFDNYHNDHRYNCFDTQNEKKLWLIFWNQLYGKNKFELHQLEKVIDAGLKRNTNPEESKKYIKELDELNFILTKDYLLKSPEMLLLKNTLELCNVDIDNYVKIFNTLFVRNINTEIIYSKNEKTNQWLVDLEKTIQHQQNPFSSDHDTATIKIVTMDNADLIVPYAYGMPFQKKLYNALVNNQKITPQSLSKEDYDLYQYIEKNLFDDELREKTDNIFESGDKTHIIYNLMETLSTLSYIISLPHQANMKSININPKLINNLNTDDVKINSETNSKLLTNENQQKPQGLYGFFEFWNKHKQINKETIDIKENHETLFKTNNSISHLYSHNIQKDSIKPSYLTAGRYLNRILGLDTNSLELSNVINYYKAYTGEIQLQFIPNNEADNWVRVYKSPHITSCMKKETTIDSIKSYAISSSCWNEKFFDKEKNQIVEMPQEDNHLVLCYFNTPELAQARAIVNTKSKQYVTSYGDTNTLDLLLEEHGFHKSNYAFENVDIAIQLKDSEAGDEISSHYFGPYVDGKARYGDTCSFINKGQIAIVNLHSNKKDSDFGLYNSDSRVIEHAHEYQCPCCFEIKSLDNDGVPLYDVKNGDAEETGDYVCARSGCTNQYHDVIYNSYTIYIANFDEAESNDWIIQDEDGQFYVNDRDTIKCNDLVYSKHNDRWYSDSKNYVYVDDEPVGVDDATYCEFNDEYILNTNAVWSDYHDSNLHEDEVVRCKILNNDVIHESCAVEIDGEYFPEDILTTDDNRNYILNDKGKKLTCMNDEEALDYMYDLQGQSYNPDEPEEEIEQTRQYYSSNRYRP